MYSFTITCIIFVDEINTDSLFSIGIYVYIQSIYVHSYIDGITAFYGLPFKNKLLSFNKLINS